MSTAFGLNLFLLSHLSMSWCCSARRCEPSCRELCPSPEARGPCCSAGVGTVRLQGGAELHWRRKGSTWPRVLAEGHRRVTGEGERLVCRAANLRLGQLKLMALVLSTGCLESSLRPWITPVASKRECKLVAAGVSGVCASLDPWLCCS